MSNALNGVGLDGATNGKDNGTYKRFKLAAKGKRVVGNLTVFDINLNTHSSQRAGKFLTRCDEDGGALFGSNRRIHLNLICSVDHDASILPKRYTWHFIGLQPMVFLELSRTAALETATELH